MLRNSIKIQNVRHLDPFQRDLPHGRIREAKETVSQIKVLNGANGVRRGRNSDG